MRWSRAWGIPLAALLYWASARLGMALFSLQPSNITLLWLPSGIGLVMVVHAGWRAVPWIAAASFAANFPGLAQSAWTGQVLHTAVAAGVDAATAWYAARQLQRWLPRGMERTRDGLVFVLRVCALPTLLSSLALAANLVWGGYIAPSAMADFAVMLLLADSLGILLVYPLFESWQRRPSGQRTPHWRFALGAALLAALLVLAHTGVPLCIYLVVPVLLFMVFQASPRQLTLALLDAVLT